MIDYFLEKKILNSIEKSKKETEIILKSINCEDPCKVFEKILNSEFRRINNFYIGLDNKNIIACIDKILIEKKEIEPEDYNFGRSIIGSSLIMVGQPILKKRFVMKGSASGTSIASKYLSRTFPQKLPVRILGTTVLGRAIGRVVPYVGWTLVAMDIVEIIIEYFEHDQKNKGGFGNGFGGGSFSGGSSGGRW